MRPIWKGNISFGLINIPVRLYSASRTRELKFKLLHKKDLSEIRYARICKADGKEVPWQDIVKGFEFETGNYVVLSEEDFEKSNVKKTKSIEILDFTDQDQIDTIYYETPYFLEPEKGAAKAYVLLREALKEAKKVAVGHFVFKQHEHLGVIKPYKNLLVLNQLRYESELVNADSLNIPKQEGSVKKELEFALKFIDQLTKPFHPSEYSDTFTDEIKEIIEKKSKGQRVVSKKAEVPKASKVQDIMSLLKESVEQHKKKKPKKTRVA